MGGLFGGGGQESNNDAANAAQTAIQQANAQTQQMQTALAESQAKADAAQKQYQDTITKQQQEQADALAKQQKQAADQAAAAAQQQAGANITGGQNFDFNQMQKVAAAATAPRGTVPGFSNSLNQQAQSIYGNQNKTQNQSNVISSSKLGGGFNYTNQGGYRFS